MKEGKQECAKPPPPPKPNLKNKDFVQWTKAESCKHSDNLVSSDWHERLQRTPLFTPVYDNAPTNMVYLLSGEYGRMWEKEREEWYSKVFVLHPKERDMNERKKKIRKQAREAKKAAEINIQERKARKAKEQEAKIKAEQEKAEKLKAKLAKCAAKKKPKKQEVKPQQSPKTETAASAESNTQGCPKGWVPVELTVQCECSHHSNSKDDGESSKEKNDGVPNEDSTQQQQSQLQQRKNQESDQNKSNAPTMCEDYIKQLAAIQQKKDQEAAVGNSPSS